MEIKKDLFEELGYINGITIIDTKAEILFSVKFNEKLHPDAKKENIIGKNLLEVFSSLNKDNSTLLKTMEVGLPIYNKDQKIKLWNGSETKTSNLSIPIKVNNQIVGAIELSAQMDKNTKINDVIEIDSSMFQKSNEVEKKLKTKDAKFTIDDIITKDKRMDEIKSLINNAANSTLPVMIYGETGTGKELFAHAIHNASSRKNKPFIAQNCAAIPENLLESILFGTSKGAFTGALDNLGLFELANGGTIFLDEINSMPIHLQSKLLRIVQDGTIRRIGSSEKKEVDVKIISASNKDPMQAIIDGELRMDLYYRLNVLSICIPPLRERKEDIPILVNYFISKYNKMSGKNVRFVSNDIFKKFNNYNWPGNVRELEYVVASGVNSVDPKIDKLEYRHMKDKIEGNFVDKNSHTIKPLIESLEKKEKEIIEEALDMSNGNITKAAILLQIPRQTLQRKTKKYNLK